MFEIRELPLQARLGLLFPFLPVPGFVHNCPTRVQQGLSGALLVSVPYLVPKNRTQCHIGASLVSSFFLGTLLL